MIYLDNAATTPLAEPVYEAMIPYLTDQFYNPSTHYRAARHVKTAVGIARNRCAQLIGASATEIVFTSGGSESDNWAVLGAVEQTGKRHVITTAIEHRAVLDTCAFLERHGVQVTYLPVDSDGLVSAPAVEAAITDDTALVSVMAANNEVGTIQPIGAIGAICRKHGVLFHTDAVQSYGHIPMDVKQLNVDLLSASAHKLHGPKGMGLLYIRNGVVLPPSVYGAGQENGLRSGTLNTAGIIGFGTAAKLAQDFMEESGSAVSRKRDLLISGIRREIPGSRLNGHPVKRLPGNVHVSIEGVDSAALLKRLDEAGICASAGAACLKDGTASYVLQAMGVDSSRTEASLRLTLSEDTTEEEARSAVEIIRDTVKKLRGN